MTDQHAPQPGDSPEKGSSEKGRRTSDDWEDRLVDRALHEVLGGQRPPDLRDRILAAAKEPSRVSTQQKESVMEKSKRTLPRWAWLALAGCLAVGVLGVIKLGVDATYEVARIQDTESADGWSTTPRPGIDMRDYGAEEPATATAATSPGPPMPRNSLHSGLAAQGNPGRSETLAAPTYPVADMVMPVDSEPTGMSSPPMPTAPAEGPVAYPDAEVWRDLSRKRQEGYANARSSRDFQVWGRRTPGELADEQGRGPGHGGDQYTRITENPFKRVSDYPLSTFSIDVDTASYANVRRFLLAENRLPPAGAVRIEELVNYFDYEYPGPTDDTPFAAHIEVAGCPWASDHRLVRVGLKGKVIEREKRPLSNLVFLLDVSGSMQSNDKLPLLKEGMKRLTKELGENDRVAIVVYASSEGLVLPSTQGDKQDTILAALDRLTSGGSTNGGAGIELAYKIAQENFIEGGCNRVLLCTDGDFNVGITAGGSLEELAIKKAKTGVFLSVLGFGRGNLNDAMMENISNKGNGNYAYIDSEREAHKVLVEQMSGTLVTIAKDVKIQVEFNPLQVAAYRLIGYENRMLAKEDFNDDTKDAGEIGAGHTVTALYELIPAGLPADTPPVDELRYQPKPRPTETDTADAATDEGETAEDDVSRELLTLKLRYKQPDGDTSTLLQFPTTDTEMGFGQASREMKFASAVASFGMLLRHSAHSGNATWAAIEEIATEAKGADPKGYRAEFLEMVRTARRLSGE